MEKNVKVVIPSNEPNFLMIEAMILALAETLLDDKQWETFETARIRRVKELFSELVKRNPQLLDETPELKKLIE